MDLKKSLVLAFIITPWSLVAGLAMYACDPNDHRPVPKKSFSIESHCVESQRCLKSKIGIVNQAEYELCLSDVEDMHTELTDEQKALLNAYYTDCFSALKGCNYGFCMSAHARARETGIAESKKSMFNKIKDFR